MMQNLIRRRTDGDENTICLTSTIHISDCDRTGIETRHTPGSRMFRIQASSCFGFDVGHQKILMYISLHYGNIEKNSGRNRDEYSNINSDKISDKDRHRVRDGDSNGNRNRDRDSAKYSELDRDKNRERDRDKKRNRNGQ